MWDGAGPSRDLRRRERWRRREPGDGLPAEIDEASCAREDLERAVACKRVGMRERGDGHVEAPVAERAEALLRRGANPRSEERRVGKECRYRGWRVYVTE